MKIAKRHTEYMPKEPVNKWDPEGDKGRTNAAKEIGDAKPEYAFDHMSAKLARQ